MDRKAVRKQLEFYFSDANLSHDGFFRAELQRAPDASISFDVLLRCNKLRALGATKCHLLDAVESSKSLKVNELGTGIQRVKPYSLAPTPPECIVLATGINFLQSQLATEESDSEGQLENGEGKEIELGEDKRDGQTSGPSTDRIIDFLNEQLKEYGKVKYVRVPRFKTSGSIRGFAFVEFGSKNSAERALSALAPTEEDLVPLPPPISASKKKVNMNGIEEDSSGWMPKLAPYASSLSLSQRLARQMVWLCCTRRSKQERAAYRRLIYAGYRRPNPLDTEYHLITEGFASTDEAVGTKRTGRLRLVSYCDWQFWRSRFYLWQRLWVERMNAKAEKLIARANRKLHAEAPVAHEPSSQNSVPSKAGTPHSEANGSPKSAIATNVSVLPSNYCPGTVVELLWPLEAEVVEHDLRKQMRHVRSAIEAGILQPHNLLHSVVHFDTRSGHHLPAQQNIPPSVDINTVARVYVRFREPQEARAFINIIVAFTSSEDAGSADNGCGSWRGSAEILEGKQEVAYCSAIATSKASSAEHRRRSQAAKRRKKTQKQSSQI